MTKLPVDEALPALIDALRRRGRVVLEAPPGAGKTTRVPPAIAQAFPQAGQVWVLEPRRLAARSAARRVAEELGEKVGGLVGHRVRFDDKTGPTTRIVFATEGVLLERLRRDPDLAGIGVVVFDEFHERHLDGDLVLGFCTRIAARRPLLLCVMSATLDGEAVAARLDAPRVTSEGRRFPVEVRYAPLDRDQPLERAVAAAARACLAEAPGDVLVFLPGAREIRAAERALGGRDDADVVPLHGDLPPDAQDRALRAGPRRKVILSTNVAETSVTIEGVSAVVDSGLARIASSSPWTGLPTLAVRKISRASAAQRAGRAGRLGPGRAVRLYGAHDHDTRPEHELPEVARADLAEALLLLAVAGIEPAAFAWLTPPPEAALRAARGLLARLDALDEAGAPTTLGRALAALPLHPRLGRLLVDAAARDAAAAGAIVTALLAMGQGPFERGRRDADVDGAADLLEDVERLRARARAGRVDFDRARREGADLGRLAELERAVGQLERAAPRGPGRPCAPGSIEEERAVLRAVLAAFPDRVARRLRPRGEELIFSEGGGGRLDKASVVRSELLVAYDAGERTAQGGVAAKGGSPLDGVLVRGAARLEPDWLLEAQLARVVDERTFAWNAAASRVEEVRRLRYGQVVIEESRTPARVGARAEDDDAIAAVLGDALADALGAGGGLAELRDELRRELDRLAFLAAALPELGLPPPPDPARGDAEDREALRRLCAEAARGRRDFGELRGLGARELIASSLSPEVARRLDRDAPETIALPGRGRARVEYPRGQSPFVASRLQDFFGLADAPKLAGGRVALTLHLLAPNGRAVQVTQDLAGFWQRHYPALRRELGRRYPRHRWPEDPLRPAVLS